MTRSAKSIISFVCHALAVLPHTVLASVINEPLTGLQPQQEPLTVNVNDATLSAPPLLDNDEETPKAFAFITDYLANSTTNTDIPTLVYAQELISTFDTALASPNDVHHVQRLWYTVFWIAMQLPIQSGDSKRLLELVAATRNASAVGGAGRAYAEMYEGYRFWWDFPFWQEAFRALENVAPGTPQGASEYGWPSGPIGSINTPNENLTLEDWANLNGFLARMNGERMSENVPLILTRGLWWLAESLETYQDSHVLEHTLPVTKLWLTRCGRMLKSQLWYGVFTGNFRETSFRGIHFLSTDLASDSQSGYDEPYGAMAGAWFERHGVPKTGHGSYRGAAIHDGSRWKFWKNALRDIGERKDLSQEALHMATDALQAMEKLDRCDAGLRKECANGGIYGF